MATVMTAFEVLSGMQTELLIFIAAVCTHAVLFGSYRFKPTVNKVKGKASFASDYSSTGPGRQNLNRLSESPSVTSLVRTVKALLRQATGREGFVAVIQAAVQAEGVDVGTDLISSLLEAVGRGSTVELLAAVRQVVSALNLKPSARLQEILMKQCLSLKAHDDFQDVLKQAKTNGTMTPSMTVLAMRFVIASSDFEGALDILPTMAPALVNDSQSIASAMPQHLIQQLVRLASHKGEISKLLQTCSDSKLLTTWTVDSMLKECGLQRDAENLSKIQRFAESCGVELTEASYGGLIRGSAGPEEAMETFNTALAKKCVGKEMMLAATEIAAANNHKGLAAAVLQNFSGSMGMEVAAGLIRLCAEGPLAGESADGAVLDLFEKHLKGIDIMAEPKAGRVVAEAALRKNRKDLLKQLLHGTTEGPRQVLLLKSFANQRRLEDAKAIFDACPEKTACLYNALLDACVDADVNTAEKVMSEAIAAGVADVVTYNTMIKRHVQRGDLRRAEAAIETMTAAGGNLTPNCVTFNELIDAMIRTNSNNSGAWMLIDKMKACGLQPNSVTCSIMLKTIQKNTKPADVDRTITFVETFMESMDEILLSSICEACIRAGRNDLLKNQLERQNSPNAVKINGAHTFGSLIRSYGLLADIKGVWTMWNEMRSRNIIPTSITIGCMVEALASSGNDPDAGLQLVHDLLADEQTRPLVNAVIFSSIVKGFTHQKRFESVWSVYEEMRKLQLEFSITTYNALIDACARSCQMCRVSGLMEAMVKDKIEANVVTYSTILKGYCQEGRLDKAFELLDAMKKSDRFHPDEITYNTLIDGCAQRGLYDSGMRLVDEMQEMRVPVSTFTLTVVAKLAGRSKKVDRAFELCETLSQKYRIKPNVHVYNNLIHASTTAGQRNRAMEVLEKMLHERVRPDVRTYKLLLTAHVNAGEVQDAIALARSACGLRGGHSRLARDASMAQPRGGLPSDLVSEVLQGISACDEKAAIQLLKDLKSYSHIKLDPKLFVSLTSKNVY